MLGKPDVSLVSPSDPWFPTSHKLPVQRPAMVKEKMSMKTCAWKGRLGQAKRRFLTSGFSSDAVAGMSPTRLGVAQDTHTHIYIHISTVMALYQLYIVMYKSVISYQC